MSTSKRQRCPACGLTRVLHEKKNSSGEKLLCDERDDMPDPVEQEEAAAA